MPLGQATSAARSNVAAIQAAIFDVAKNHSGLAWWGSSSGTLPRGLDVKGLPYLAVTNGIRVGSIQSGQFIAGELAREPGISEPVWEFDVYGLWPWHPGDSATFSTPQAALTYLEQAFTIYWTAEQTSQAAWIAGSDCTALQLQGGHKFAACKVTLRASEMLLVDYSPSP